MENIGAYLEIELDLKDRQALLAKKPFLTNTDVSETRTLSAKRRMLLNQIFEPVLKRKDFQFLSPTDLTFLYKSPTLTLQMLTQYRSAALKFGFPKGYESPVDNRTQYLMDIRTMADLRSDAFFDIRRRPDLRKIMQVVSPQLLGRIDAHCDDNNVKPSLIRMSEAQYSRHCESIYREMGLVPDEKSLGWLKLKAKGFAISLAQSVVVRDELISFLDSVVIRSQKKDSNGPGQEQS